MKTCFKCRESKQIEDFYEHSNKCKDCAKKDANANRLAKLDYYQAYDRDRANLPERVAVRKRFAEIWAKDGRRTQAIRRYRESHPLRYIAHTAVHNALRDGRLVKSKSCSLCGIETTNLQAHHSDYSKPLDVTWLCISCHSALHKEMARRLRQKHKLPLAN